MEENKLVAAITALLTIGILLLNLGGDLVKNGDYNAGIPLILMGTALIVTAVFLTTTLTKNVAENHMKLLALHELQKSACC